MKNSTVQLFKQHEMLYLVEIDGQEVGLVSLERTGRWSYLIDDESLDVEDCKTGKGFKTAEEAANALSADMATPY